jgi:tetratricopeptide (TPR) repeat protein
MVAEPETGTILHAVRCILSSQFQYDPHGSNDAWPGLRDLLPSTIAWCKLARADSDSSVGASPLKAAVGDLYLLDTVGCIIQNVNGDAKSALVFKTEARQWAEKVLPKDHPYIAVSMSNLATSLLSLGRHKEALKLQEETLAFQKQILPEDNAHIMISLSNLAASLSSLGRHKEALKLQEETLALAKKILPKDHPIIASFMSNLAGLMLSVGRPKEALKLQEETLALQKQILPKDHPHIMNSMNNLGRHKEALGRHKEALKLQEETLALRKEILPKDHPDIAMSMNNLAGSLMHFRRHRPAEAMYRDALMILMRAGFDRSHPNIGRLANGLQWAKIKGELPNALKLPKPKTPCSCGSGVKYRGCCF